jgi:hypothetical protein
MNTLEYIDGLFKIALESYQHKEEVSVADSQSILLSISDKIRKELNNNFLKVCMDIQEHNPQIADRICYGGYMLPFDKVEIKFGKNE